MNRTIDLNCDLGESDSIASLRSQLDLLDSISSANIACGGHAGDEFTMLATIAAALARNVSLGAHPSYPDRSNFGRISIPLAAAQIESLCFDQITTLNRIAQANGGRLTHIKPHGALYHDAMTDTSIAAALGRTALRIDSSLIMIGLPAAPALSIWRAQGLRVVTEAFADRAYEPDGSLRKRTLPDALITDPAAAAAQALSLATSTTPPGTICIHSDTANALHISRAVRAALSDAGFTIASPA